MEPYPKYYLYKRLVQAKLFIDSHFEQTIDLNHIADEACFSKFHFIRLFHSIYGKTPHQYLIAIRMERAAQLLRAGAPVSKVCYSVGFESQSTFSGLFKRRMGLAPSAFLAYHQSRRKQITEAPLQFIPACFAGKNGWSENRNFEEES